MNAIRLFDDLSTRLERVRRFNSLLNQIDDLGLDLELPEHKEAEDEACLERLRLTAYEWMIAAHNAQQEINAVAANAESEGVL